MGFKDDVKNAVNWDVPGVAPTDTLRVAMQIMADHRLSALVVRRDGEVAGVVTDMDIVASIGGQEDLDGMQVADIMTGCQLITGKSAKIPCVQLASGHSVKLALDVMKQGGIRNLVVAGEDDKPVAVFSALDLFRRLLEPDGS